MCGDLIELWISTSVCGILPAQVAQFLQLSGNETGRFFGILSQVEVFEHANLTCSVYILHLFYLRVHVRQSQ